jgi:hypothetical protein
VVAGNSRANETRLRIAGFRGSARPGVPAELSLAGDALTAIDDAGAISFTIRVRDFTFSEEA